MILSIHICTRAQSFQERYVARQTSGRQKTAHDLETPSPAHKNSNAAPPTKYDQHNVKNFMHTTILETWSM